MIARAIAWCIVLVVLASIWHYGSKWKSPWSLPSVASPVLSNLPKASDGCTEACK